MENSPKHILLVEDDVDISNAIKLLLGRSGFSVKTSSTVANALDLAANEHFDLFILDTFLQDGTGLELCREIREFDQDTPILFHPASVIEGDRKKSLRAGTQAYVTKPADFDELERLVSELVSANLQKIT